MSGVPFALLRHAPTRWNEQGRLQGRADIPLSRRGRALAVGWRLPPPFDGWPRIASPLARARQTASLLTPVRPFAIDRRLREVSFGLWEGGSLTRLEPLRRRRAFAPGGEPPPALRRRLRDWARHVAMRGEPVLAVSHKGIIRAVRRLAGQTGQWRDDCLQVFEAHADGGITPLQGDVALVGSR